MTAVAAASIEVRDLSIGFESQSGALLPILRNIDLAVGAGESIGLVGESGCGKSTLALAMMGYLTTGLTVLGGGVRFRGRDMFGLSMRDLEEIRGGDLALIPQNAGRALTPTMRVGAQVVEALRLHSPISESERPARVVELLTQVRLPDPAAIMERYPHELSGGQQQRLAIAMALAGEPNALLLDEPTTGLDVTTQAHILELLRDLAREFGTTMVYVSHDLGAIARVCERVVVMYAGEVALDGPVKRVLRAPAHPYAQGLLASIPRLAEARLPDSMEGRPPPPGGAGAGCAFVDRCPLAVDRCAVERPPLFESAAGERIRCLRHEEAAARTTAAAAEMANGRAIDAATPVALSLADIAITYQKPSVLQQLLGRRSSDPPTVDDINLAARRGETVGLVGESGSGKSTILKAIAGLQPPVGGAIAAPEGRVLNPDVDARGSDERRRIQLVFQNPDESLNPRHTVGEILAQPLRLYFGLKGKELVRRSEDLLERVRLGPHYLSRLPSQLSGGEKQRVAIARAFAAEPDLILCDEVTSALDVSVQAAVLNLLDRLRRDHDTTYVFVSHDLAVVRALADRVAVLYQGRLCEVGPSARVYELPSHPYTEVLLGAVLEPDPDIAPTLDAEDVVELSPAPKGCWFQRRCPRRLGSVCDEETPPWRPTEDGHWIRCHIPLDRLREDQTASSRELADAARGGGGGTPPG